MGVVARTFRRSAIGLVAAALALSSAACTVAVEPRSTYSAPASTPSATPSADAAVAPAAGTVGQSPAAALAPAAASAAALVELAELGRDRSTAQPVKAAAASLMSIGTNLSDALGKADPAVTVAASTDMTSTLRDLGARTGADFDPAWLRAATDALSGAATAADGIAAATDVPDAVKDGVRKAVAGLDGTRSALRAAGVSAGAAAPTQVQAGDGGWAGERSTWLTIAGIALVGLGGAMLGGAVRRRVRH